MCLNKGGHYSVQIIGVIIVFNADPFVTNLLGQDTAIIDQLYPVYRFTISYPKRDRYRKLIVLLEFKQYKNS